MPDTKTNTPPIEILPDQLSDMALAGVIESFILREGTDYGALEVSFEKKSEQIRSLIQKREIKIIFDPTSESVTLLTDHDFLRLTKKPH